MKIKGDKLKYAAELTRIKLTKDEGQLFSKQLNQILEYIDKLNKLDTKKVEPMSHALNIFNVTRDDKVKPSLNREDVLKNAPSKNKGFFQVPKII